MFRIFGIDHYDNTLKSTFKSGILYENLGKKKDKHFHPFRMNMMAIHYIPELLSKTVLESGLFKVTEKNIKDPEKEIDANYIIDCRGRNNRDKNLYRNIINPINSVILSNKKGRDVDLIYTRCIATPNGWTFAIPNHDSVSYAYLYNNTITSKEDAEKDFDIFTNEIMNRDENRSKIEDTEDSVISLLKSKDSTNIKLAVVLIEQYKMDKRWIPWLKLNQHIKEVRLLLRKLGISYPGTYNRRQWIKSEIDYPISTLDVPEEYKMEFIKSIYENE